MDNISYTYDRGRLSSITQGSRATNLTFYDFGTQTPGYVLTVTAGDATTSSKTTLIPDESGRPQATLTGAVSTPLASMAGTYFDWDDEGNLKSAHVDTNAATQTYTPVNLLDSFRAPGSALTLTKFTYNSDRSLEYVSQPGNQDVDFVYDTTKQQLDGILASGQQDAAFEYYNSLTCPGCASGRLHTATRGGTTLTLSYNGPLTTSQSWAGTTSDAVNGSVSWGYNADFRATSEIVSPAPTVSGLGTVSYDYDADGLPTCASLGTCAPTTTKNKLSLSYGTTTGILTGTSLDSVSEAYTTNEYGETATYLAKLGTSPLLSITYDGGAVATKRDGLGRVLHETDATPGGTVTTDYQYDDQGRLSKVCQGGAVLNEYLYDPRGNRVSSDGVTTNAHYDVQDRLEDFDDSAYSYYTNAARSERKEGTTITGQYVYDALGNLSQFVKPGAVQVDYAVDALDRRISKKNNGALVAEYIYGTGGRIAAVLDGAGSLAARFVYASHPNTPDYMVLPDGTVYKFLCDQLGSPRLIVNSTTGAVAERIDYDGWGKATLSTTAAFASWQQPFGFAGGLYDDDTGLVRFGARDYDPEVGRWLSKDPILFSGGQTNLYVYAGNDPVNRVDPNGEFVQIAAGAVIGASINLVGYVALTSVSDINWSGVGAAVLGGGLSGGSTAAGGPVLAAIGGGVGYLAEAAISGQGWSLEGLTTAVVANAAGGALGEGSLNKLLQLTDNYALARGSLLAGSGVTELAAVAEAEATARSLGGSTAFAFLGRWVDQLASPTPCLAKRP